MIILLGVALESVRARFGTRLARIATAAVLLLVLWDRGLPLAQSPMHRVQAFTPEARATYDEVAQLVAAEGDGPLLELPIFGLLPGTDQSGRTLEPDAMLASTLHWWPTPAAHLSYHPAHRGFFMAVAEALSLPRNLADLVDLTHVRWLLLRPAAQWLPGTRPTVMSTLSSSPDVGRISQLHGGWTLVRLDRVPQHAQWFENVRRGGAQGLSVLGSPLAPIPEAQAIASVRLESTLGEGTVGQKVLGRATVRNGGDRPWAVVPTPLAPLTLDGRWANESSRDGTVVLMERWRKLDANGEPSAAVLSEHESHLRHDVDPGEELRQLISLTLPAEPGAYQLELQVAQVGGATFTAAGNSPERRRVEVKAAPPAGG